MNTKVREMLELQEKFNLETNGIDWKLGTSDNGKRIDWLRCIYMEATEIIDSTPWKHWKDIDGKIDIENLQIEIVDIWHFLMSKMLVDNSIDSCVEIIEHKINNNTDKDILSNKDILEITEHLMYVCIQSKFEGYPIYGINNILLDIFFEVVIASNMTLEDIYKLYIGKNCLNQFRQDNGYKDGTYMKIWNYKEDNIVMKELIDNKELDFNGLYKELEIVYNKIK